MLSGLKGPVKDVIAVRGDRKVLVKFKDGTKTPLSREGWIAVLPEIVERGKTDPSSFHPSESYDADAIVFDESRLARVTNETPLVIGTPVRAPIDNNWHRVYIIKLFDDGSVRITWPGQSTIFNENRQRQFIRIDRSTLAELKQPGIAESYLANVKDRIEGGSPAESGQVGMSKKVAPVSNRYLKPYPIKIAIPDEAQLVEADMMIEPGMALAASWAGKWYNVTVRGVHDDGALRIHWNDFGAAFDCDMARSDLIIRKVDVRKSKPTALRTWSDVTGKFKVEAIYLRRSGGDIFLRGKDGTTMKVPFDKLSEADQRIIESIKD